MGYGITRIYALFFHFPVLIFRMTPEVAIGGAGIAIASAVVGALGAVRRVVQLPPAEAMRPEAPARYGESWAERAGLKRWLSQPARIILRTLQRHPGRVALSIIGIALGGSLLVVGNFSRDAITVMMDTQFNIAERQDVTVTLVEPSSAGALDDFRRLPGVIDAEPFRAVPVRLRFGPRSRTVAILGVMAGARLNRVIDVPRRPLDLAPGGLVLSRKLADLIGAGRGDVVTLEVLEGTRSIRQVRVANLVEDYLGINAYMDLASLHQLLQEGGTVSGAYLQVDRAAERTLYQQLKATPRVAGVLPRRAAIDSFETTVADMLRKAQVIYVVFAAIIAFGVVYNSARISLSERSRELATLRVIGFSRGEISYILLGELTLVTVAAVPLGLVMGYGFVAALVRSVDTEMFRLPLVVAPASYAVAGATIVVATAISALVVRRRLDHLDLVEVLKARE
jgi:putative ABC transport system permease protein